MLPMFTTATRPVLLIFGYDSWHVIMHASLGCYKFKQCFKYPLYLTKMPNPNISNISQVKNHCILFIIILWFEHLISMTLTWQFTELHWTHALSTAKNIYSFNTSFKLSLLCNDYHDRQKQYSTKPVTWGLEANTH